MVLARKYRPRGFDTMVGQGHVVQALSNALTQQRLHHAYLFTGTRGVGKTTVSRILAKSLNCVGLDGQGTITASPCGQCQPCRDIDAGRFVDYVELDAASNRGVEEISQLLEQSVYKPVVGRFKVYLIDEVHMLSNTAFNAMLKTLEEPPDYLKFVLATTDPQKVPVTVLSRCLQFNLRPMAAQTVQEHLGEVLRQEGIESEPEALRLLSRAARGSMRDAMSLTDQAIAFGNGSLQEGPVRQMLGAVDRQHVQRLIEAVAAGDGGGLVAAVDTLRQLGLSASGTLEELAAALQRMAVIQSVPGMPDSDDPDEATWRRLAPLLAPDETQLFYSLCLQGRAELALAPDEYSGLVMLMLRLLAFKPGGLPRQGASPPPKAEGSVAAASQQAEPVAVSARQPSGAQPRAGMTSVAGSIDTSTSTPLAGPSASARPAMKPAVMPAATTSAGATAPAPGPASPPIPAGVATAAPPSRPLSRAPSASPSSSIAATTPAVPSVTSPRERPSGSQAGQSLPPWEVLPPEAEAAFMADEPPALGQSDMDMMDAMGLPERSVARAPAPARAPEDNRPESRPEEARAVSIQLPPPGSDPVSDAWAETVAQLHAKGAIAALVRELAIQSQCISREHADGRTVLRLKVERESLRTDSNRERLSQALAQHLGHEVLLEFERGTPLNTPAQREQVARELRQHQAQNLVQNDPLVRSLMTQYPGARIVPGSIRPM